ncbi:MAG: hypothetical protein LBE21_08815 [Pseudomonadales bacterium]|jgi:hypothetical protein|nr:hypothetical protein [Pseudomonadales bacterium]
MKKYTIATLALLLGFTTPAFAQQGHPLAGTWLGDWGPDASTRHFLILIMDWDGQAITGSANPGPDATPIDTLTLDSSDWSVNIDMTVKDSQSQPVHFKGEGTINDLGSQTRNITGTWSDDEGHNGSFRLERQSGP